MSYCRIGPDSDVYLYSGAPGIVCCACRLTPKEPWYADVVSETAAHALQHLTAHKAAGHKVPARAIRRLREEMQTP